MTRQGAGILALTAFLAGESPVFQKSCKSRNSKFLYFHDV